MGRLALTMGAIAIAAVALSMTLVYHALDGRLNRLAAAHVESSANRVAAIAADRYAGGRFSPTALSELVERSRAAGFDITVTDLAGHALLRQSTSIPIAVAAPGLLSTTSGCPRRGARVSASSRAMLSVAPPGGNGTINLIGFAGQFCARDSGLARPPTSVARPVASALRRDVLFTSSSSPVVAEPDSESVRFGVEHVWQF